MSKENSELVIRILNEAEILESNNKFTEAEALLVHGVQAFPNDARILMKRARQCRRTFQWVEAVRCWTEVLTSYPDNTEAQYWLNIGQYQLVANNIAEQDEPHYNALGKQDYTLNRSREAEASRELLMKFQSLGETCEFGAVQRHHWAEPIDLFRWAGMPFHNLIRGLIDRFPNIGSLTCMEATCSPQGEYQLLDRSSNFMTHTWEQYSVVESQEYFQKQCRRLRFLRDKLFSDLAEGEKIFVFKKSRTDMNNLEINALLSVLRTFGNAPLLCVVKCNENQPEGSVELHGDGLLIGYIDRYIENPMGLDINYNCWREICERVVSKLGQH